MITLKKKLRSQAKRLYTSITVHSITKQYTAIITCRYIDLSRKPINVRWLQIYHLTQSKKYMCPIGGVFPFFLSFFLHSLLNNHYACWSSSLTGEGWFQKKKKKSKWKKKKWNSNVVTRGHRFLSVHISIKKYIISKYSWDKTKFITSQRRKRL